MGYPKTTDETSAAKKGIFSAKQGFQRSDEEIV
jgi:hypothetical protein